MADNARVIVDREENWFLNEEFWVRYRPLMFDPDRLEDTPLEAGFLIREGNPPAGGSILDLCCGEGRHSLILARKGYTVTGIDTTPAYLDKARERAAADRLAVEFLLADVREFRKPGAYDLAFNWFTSFGYFDDTDEDFRMVRNAFDSLRPGGRLVIETLGKESVCLNFKEREWFQRDGFIILLEYALTESCTRLENRWLFHPDTPGAGEGMTEARFSVRLYSAEEMGRLLGRAGFGRFRFYGGIDGSPYDHNAKTMIIVAEKGE